MESRMGDGRGTEARSPVVPSSPVPSPPALQCMRGGRQGKSQYPPSPPALVAVGGGQGNPPVPSPPLYKVRYEEGGQGKDHSTLPLLPHFQGTYGGRGTGESPAPSPPPPSTRHEGGEWGRGSLWGGDRGKHGRQIPKVPSISPPSTLPPPLRWMRGGDRGKHGGWMTGE